MASKQTAAFLLLAMLAVACVSVHAAPDCMNPNNCYLCKYCDRKSECNGNYPIAQYANDQQHIDGCHCAYQCDGACKGFCGYSAGKRHLLMRAPGMNELAL